MVNFAKIFLFNRFPLCLRILVTSTPTWMITPNITFGFDMILRMRSADQIYWELRNSIYKWFVHDHSLHIQAVHPYSTHSPSPGFVRTASQTGYRTTVVTGGQVSHVSHLLDDVSSFWLLFNVHVLFPGKQRTCRHIHHTALYIIWYNSSWSIVVHHSSL